MAKKNPGPAAQAAARISTPVESIGVKAGPGESRIQDPGEPTVWDPNGESQETPPDDKTVPAVDDTGKPAAPVNDADKQARIRKLLSNETEPAAETTEDKAAADDKPAAEPAKPASRRDMLASLGAEREKRVLENQLKEERQKREDAEKRADAARKLATEGDILSIARAKGLTADQAIDLLMNPPAEGTKPAAPAPTDDTGARLTRLEQRERELVKREALSVLDEATKDMDIPVTRATTRVAVADDKGQTRVMTGRELVLATAQRLWEADGKPAGDRRKYIAEAAPLVEQQLIDDDKERLEAYAKKVGGGAKPAGDKPAAAAKPATAKKPPVPSVGTRSGGATEKSEPPELPEDPDERRQAIKRRLGWGS